MAGVKVPLAKVDGFPHNLPVQLTSFVGRDAEMAQVRTLLAASRLVTLTGAGGVGKTRLALEVAASMTPAFPAGAWLVDLAPLTDPALVAVTVARALGLPDQDGLETIAMVTGFIGRRRALVVMDNCEHLLDTCAQFAEELLRTCPGLVILATSREPVGAASETTWRVPSLALESDAIELFIDRAQRARPGFAISPENAGAVAEICRRLDGIPLAIELAAARLRAFSPAEIASGLHDRFRLLTGASRTAARRQQTLRASVDWSHALLTEPERVLFRRLAAFAGGFDLDAAEAVGPGLGLERHQVLDQLALLVDKSLVAAEESQQETRYRLPETIRQYAAEKLADSGEAAQARTLHRNYYAATAGRLDAAGDGDMRRQIRLVEADIDNVRAAFEWSMELGERDSALRIASSLMPVWLGRCRMVEGEAWLDAALGGQQASAETIAPAVWVRAVADVAMLHDYAHAPGVRRSQTEEAVALAREIGDPGLLSRALLGTEWSAGLAESGRPYEEAAGLARKIGDGWTLRTALGRLAFCAILLGDPVAGRALSEEALTLAEKAGDDHLSRYCRTWLCIALLDQGDFHRTKALCNGLIAEAEAEAERAILWKIWGLAFLGTALAFLGEPQQARAAGEASIAIAYDRGIAIFADAGYSCLATAAQAAGDLSALLDAARTGCRLVSDGPEVRVKYAFYLAEAELAAGSLAAARAQADEGIATASRLEMKSHLMGSLLASARVAAAVGDAGRASDDAYQALAIGRGIESQLGIIEALECLGGLARDDADCQKATRLLAAAHTLRNTIGYQRFLLRQPGYEAAVQALRSALGDDAFARAWEEGAALSLDDAVNYALRGRGERNRPPIGWLSLTPAEHEVARLVAEGLGNKDIASQLFISPRTVQTHLTHVYGKLGITSRLQLAQQAARHV